MGDSWPDLKQHVFRERYYAQHAGKNNALLGLQFEASFIFINFLSGSGGYCH
jgi:hypothetical protein